MKKNNQIRAGFTMIELLVAATIIVVLSTIGLVSYRNASKSARDGKRKADLETIRSALVLYKTDAADGLYPDGAYSTMIGTLVTADYLDTSNINDPKQDATYTYTPQNSRREFELCATLETAPEGESSYCVSNP